ncbi:aminotransferase class V-fold PLP-dependent enzyme [Actinocatenispora rupis]|uniref:Aminotransferase n=1 Tax=Actinocatenispora rupis TaxID=519421 RepID=A0A8J3JGL2_9ACTN|nr:aminotransferase class V-fold PLP-dependent enzyme [Actinocatenispora rupis]GID16344.1 aminotransferase [Actinocatenispora rupis]
MPVSPATAPAIPARREPVRESARPRLVPVPRAERPDPLVLLDAEVTVPLVTGDTVGYANFDYAASAPCATAAADAINDLLPRYASVHRGAGLPSQLCTRRYEEARGSVARFLGCRPDDTVLFTRNTTDATNLLAHVLPADATVVVFDSEHHATLLPWRRAVRLPVPDSPGAAVRAVDAALRELHRDGPAGPVLVAVTGASNVTGELWPVGNIVTVAHRYGARVFVDAAQLAPHRPVDVAALDVDYVALSGHKLYAPFGAGVLAGRPDWLAAAGPYLAGGGATALVGDATNDVRWSAGAARHEAGSPNVLGAVALGAVCDALLAADRAALADRERRLTDRLRAGLAAIDGVVELSLFAPDSPRVGIAAFAVRGLDSDVLAAALSAEYGIGVRDGLFCAHPLTRRLLHDAGTDAPATAVRASIGLGTTEEQVDRLVAAVAELAANGPRWTYERPEGRPVPVPDPRVW